jgi:hypothetical protein|tara:strand:+ start:417 stop:1211 length:795 start_codon:yes stop_codon:yes gene_type:complete
MREKDLKEDLATMAYKAESDHEVQMARSDLYKIAKYSIKLHEMLKAVNEQQGIEGWVQSKITKAADYMGSVYHHLDYEMKFDEMTEAKKAKPDYIDIDGDGDKKEPMKKAVKDKKNKKTTEEAKPVDDDDPRYADDENLPKNKKKKKESLTLDSIYKNRLQEQLESKLSEKSKGLYYNVNKRKKAGTSRKKGHPDAPSEKDWENAAKTAKESKETKCPDCGKPSYKTLPEEKQKGVDGKVCWKGYKRMGTKKKGGKTVDNCVKI